MGVCRFCGSTNVTKNGMNNLSNRTVQQCRCKDCQRRFTNNLGFERKRATPEQITTAVDLVFTGLSMRKVVASLKMTGLEISNVTVYKWADQYGKLMDKYLDKITLQVGESWRADEIYLKIRGNCKYLFAMLDSETRFWLSQMIAEKKGKDDMALMFKDAETLAGKKPTTLISDGAPNFHHIWKKQWRPKNRTHKNTEHHRYIHLSGDMNNSQMESFNGATVRHREKIVHGLKKEDSAILTGLRIYHNHVRPHLGFDGKIPREVARIHIEGNDK